MFPTLQGLCAKNFCSLPDSLSHGATTLDFAMAIIFDRASSASIFVTYFTTNGLNESHFFFELGVTTNPHIV